MYIYVRQWRKRGLSNKHSQAFVIVCDMRKGTIQYVKYMQKVGIGREPFFHAARTVSIAFFCCYLQN